MTVTIFGDCYRKIRSCWWSPCKVAVCWSHGVVHCARFSMDKNSVARVNNSRLFLIDQNYDLGRCLKINRMTGIHATEERSFGSVQPKSFPETCSFYLHVLLVVVVIVRLRSRLRMLFWVKMWDFSGQLRNHYRNFVHSIFNRQVPHDITVLGWNPSTTISTRPWCRCLARRGRLSWWWCGHATKIWPRCHVYFITVLEFYNVPTVLATVATVVDSSYRSTYQPRRRSTGTTYSHDRHETGVRV